MTNFSSLERTLCLKKFLASPLGTLYFVPYAPGSPRIVVRCFDGPLRPDMAPVYADLVRAIQHWIERQPSVDALARVVEPAEVGDDYVARPHHTYSASTNSYYDDEDPVEAPAEWARLITAVREAPPPANHRDALVAEVARRSLAEPNGKTYFNETEGRFIVVDPKLAIDDVRRWAELQEAR
jgi:hypothetical protein